MSQISELHPTDIHEELSANRITLVDVREPKEFANERIPGALLLPLSTFDPSAMPVHPDRPVVLYCGSAMRSAKAVSLCLNASVDVKAHMAGGIKGWKQAGLKTLKVNPFTGQINLSGG